MTLRINIVANYGGQAYAGLVGLLVTPIYLSIIGPEAYGLIAIYALLQTLLPVLEFGLGAAMVRETARFKGGGVDAAALWQLLRSLEWLFWPTGIFICACLALGAPRIARDWLQLASLSQELVHAALVAMAFAVGTGWIAGLYRAVILGLEKQVTLNALHAAFTTVRFVVVIPLILEGQQSVAAFFWFQTAVSVLELLALAITAIRGLPRSSGARPSIGRLRSVAPFAGTIALASVVWVLVTQVDKIVLSRLLPLADYGLFSAVVMLTSVISMFGFAVSQALLPRMTRDLSDVGLEASLQVYRAATRGTALLAGSLAVTMAVCAQEILWMWFGDRALSVLFAPVLALYAGGNAMVALASYSYCLQYAHGRMRLHLVGNIIFAVTLIPTIIVAARLGGAQGAGWAWLGVAAIFLVVWVPIVHAHFAPGLHLKWLLQDVALPLIAPLLVGGVAWWFGSSGEWHSRVVVGIRVVLVFVSMIVAGFAILRLWHRHSLQVPAARAADKHLRGI